MGLEVLPTRSSFPLFRIALSLLTWLFLPVLTPNLKNRIRYTTQNSKKMVFWPKNAWLIA
jgi:hypothetical protein